MEILHSQQHRTGENIVLNKAAIIGRLGNDIELRYSGSGVAIANFNIATDESYNDRDGNKQEKTEWHKIVCFKNLAENCATYIGKGSLVYVEGSLQTRQYQDQSGTTRYVTEVKAQQVKFLDKRGETSGSQQQQQPRQQSQQQQRKDAFPTDASGMDEYPF